MGVTGGLAYSSSIPGVVSKSLEAPPKIPIYAADDFYETFEREMRTDASGEKFVDSADSASQDPIDDLWEEFLNHLNEPFISDTT